MERGRSSTPSENTRREKARTMRAARITEPGRVVMEDVPIPEPGPGQVRVALEGSGVCASNLGPWQGLPWLRYPLGPGDGGHEGWGMVDALGAGVAGIRPGDRVAVLSYSAYAEYDLASADNLVVLPKELNALPFPGEALGCAMNIFRRSRVEAGQRVAIVGAGFLGALLTRLATLAGAEVYAISRRPYALEVAKGLGAVRVIASKDRARVVEEVRELTRGQLCDRVIEATGKQEPLDLAAELTRERGTLVVAGYHQDGPRTVNMQLWNWRGLDVINAHERDPRVYLAGIHAAVVAVLEGKLDPRPLITHRFPLECLGEALDATADRPEGFLKAVVTT